MTKKLSNKDKKDWEDFIVNNEKIVDKDLLLKKNSQKRFTHKIDLHGLSLEEANKTIENFIKICFKKNIFKIIVITGKGLRSNNKDNPYVSKDFAILKHSVPGFIKSNEELMKMIINISDAKIEDGGSGSFYIYLKKKK